MKSFIKNKKKIDFNMKMNYLIKTKKKIKYSKSYWKEKISKNNKIDIDSLDSNNNDRSNKTYSLIFNKMFVFISIKNFVELQTYKDRFNKSDKDLWIEALNNEFNSLKKKKKKFKFLHYS